MNQVAPAPTTPRRGHRATTVLGWATMVSLGATYGLGLSLPASVEQKDYSKLIGIHPGLAWASYVAVGMSAVAAIAYFVRRDRRWDRLNAASIEVGVVFTALTLVTGSLWGRPVWGVWWQWDPRLTTEALLLALLLGFVALRRAIVEPGVRAAVCAAFSLLLVPLLVIIHFSVQWWRSLHQNGSLVSLDPGTNLDAGYLVAMVLGFVSFTLAYGWLTIHRVRLEVLEETEEEASLGAAIAARRAEAVTA